jgi:hypothetical protein
MRHRPAAHFQCLGGRAAFKNSHLRGGENSLCNPADHIRPVSKDAQLFHLFFPRLAPRVQKCREASAMVAPTGKEPGNLTDKNSVKCNLGGCRYDWQMVLIAPLPHRRNPYAAVRVISSAVA